MDVTALLGGGSPILFDACFSDVVLLGTIPIVEVLGELCFSLIQDLLGQLLPARNEGGNSTTTTTTNANQDESAGRACLATLDNQECTSCTICANGLKFDCSNIESEVASAECVPMNWPTTFSDVYNPKDLVFKK